MAAALGLRGLPRCAALGPGIQRGAAVCVAGELAQVRKDGRKGVKKGKKDRKKGNEGKGKERERKGKGKEMKEGKEGTGHLRGALLL